jgi:transcriptional regulator with XRE-family HTH domain
MSQKQLLMHALKRELKRKHITYADIAKALRLSESSIKRLLKEGDVSISRLECICALAGLDLGDLLELMQRRQVRTHQLTSSQELRLVDDKALMLVSICVLNHWQLDEITHYYTLSKAQCIEKLIVLDQLKIISLQPNNRIKLLIASDFSWISSGPIEQFFKRHLEHDFFRSAFSAEHDVFLSQNAMLTEEDMSQIKGDLGKLSQKLSHFNDKNRHLPVNKLKGSALVLGFRPWIPEIFQKFTR